MAQKFIGETSGKYWKQKNDETYVNEEELVKITDLEETTSVDDSDLLIKGNPSAGTMLKIKVANFLDGIKEKLLGSTDISSIGDGTVTGAINTNAETIASNKEDADGKYTELNSALADIQSDMPFVLGGYVSVSVSASSYADADVTFSTSVPSRCSNYRVICCLAATSTSANYGSISPMVYSQSRTGCTIRVANASSSSFNPSVYWAVFGY